MVIIASDTPTPSQKQHKKDPALDELAKELKKIYGDTYIHPDHAKKYWKPKSSNNDNSKENENDIKRNAKDHNEDSKDDQNFAISSDNSPTDNGIVTAEINKKVQTFGDFPINILTNLQDLSTKRNLEQTNNSDYGDPFVVDNLILGPTDSLGYSFGWNLDRLDQRYLPLDQRYVPVNSGVSPTSQPIHVYVVDTGIEPSHESFSTVTISMDYPSSSGAKDCNGHGTHVASTVAGIASGVIANVLKQNPLSKYDVVLHAVKVLDCTGSGSTFDVISGLLWIYDNAQYPAIVTMSLGSTRSYNMDNIASLLITNKNIPIIAAAGNNNQDACYVSPAAANGVFAVGSTGTDDTRSTFSNYGTCVDVYCPGEDILGAYYLSTTGYWYLSGTSMATPQTTGSIVAYTFLYQRGTSVNDAAMNGFSHFKDNLTKDVVKGSLGGSVNQLCYAGAATVEIVPTPTTVPAKGETNNISFFVVLSLPALLVLLDL